MQITEPEIRFFYPTPVMIGIMHHMYLARFPHATDTKYNTLIKPDYANCRLLIQDDSAVNTKGHTKFQEFEHD